MKKILLAAGVCAVLLLAVGISRSVSLPNVDSRNGPNAIQVKYEDKNPWTGTKLNVNSEQFQFAIMSDRTGGHRDKIFSRAVLQVNLLQPQFVMSVGDLIEGFTIKEETIKKEWDEFDGYVQKLEMPFFYVSGNHDTNNKVLVEKWGERYGRRYYHFVYKNVLFLCLCSDNPPDLGTIDPAQREYVRKTLEDNKEARWTFVFVHRPIWTGRDLEKNGWAEVEKDLTGRKYTIFCGHVHRYQKYIRNGMNHYQLATTGGGSRLRGVGYGEFDQIAWVTMKPEAPLIANVLLDGILPEDLQLPDTDEKAQPSKKKPTQPVSGKVSFNGQALEGATVRLHLLNEETGKYMDVADGLSDLTGRFQLSCYSRFDGCPAGEYLVTVVKTGKGFDDGETGMKTLLPALYAAPKTTPLRMVIKEGVNDVGLELDVK